MAALTLAGLASCATELDEPGDPEDISEIISEVSPSPNDEAAFRFLVGKGLTDVQAAGIVGNLDQESGMNPSSHQNGGGVGRGIAQWSVGGRWDTTPNANVVAFARARNQSPWSLQLQLEFLWFELTSFPTYGLAELRGATTVENATIIFQNRFERCGTCHTDTRIRYARAALAAYGGSSCSVIGDINARYQSLGGAGGFLGRCLTNELTTPDGIGRYNHFVGGSIYWTPSTGAWEVHGDIRNLWESMGWELSGLGYPVSNETSTPDLVGRFNHFQNGSIYWKPGIGAREVRGDIHAKWAAMGWELGVLGYPTTNETSTPDLVGRFNHFEGGSIYWTPSTGAFEVHGAIRERWTALGWELSALGYPTSDETVLGCSNGRKNTFQGGAIYWTAALGAHEVVGPVLTKLLELGGACGQLGYPTAAPVQVTGGTLYAFERGGLLLTPSGSVVVQ